MRWTAAVRFIKAMIRAGVCPRESDLATTSSAMDHDKGPVSYSRFACVGTGFAGIALGAQLKRWYGISDVRFFERHDDLGGTWFANKYPGIPLHSLVILKIY